MRVWERGSGETAACGTGACAATVAGVLTGRTGPRVLVHLVGGDLDRMAKRRPRIHARRGRRSVHRGAGAPRLSRGSASVGPAQAPAESDSAEASAPRANASSAALSPERMQSGRPTAPRRFPQPPVLDERRGAPQSSGRAQESRPRIAASRGGSAACAPVEARRRCRADGGASRRRVARSHRWRARPAPDEAPHRESSDQYLDPGGALGELDAGEARPQHGRAFTSRHEEAEPGQRAANVGSSIAEGHGRA